MKSRPRSFRVGVFLNRDIEPGRQRAYGVLRFASVHPEWEVTLLPDCPADETDSAHQAARFDGIIAYALIYPELRQRHPDVRHFAIADMAMRPKGESVAAVDIDNLKIGEVAARFFFRRGFRHFAYVRPFRPRKWSTDRERAFQAELRAHGHLVHVYDRPSDDGLADWLGTLPKPCAILAAMDWRARHVAEACRRSGILIPEQIALLGVDNDDLLCEFTLPPLSSVNLDFELCGYLMAEALDRMMRGGKPPRKALEYGVKGIVERKSTIDIKGSARIVTGARDFIKRNLTAPITLADIASAVGCSIRVLQKRFAETTGHSPLAELRQQRLALVCDRLIHTTQPITGIGESCGFASDAQLKNIFRKTYGTSMRDYRQNACQVTSPKT